MRPNFWKRALHLLNPIRALRYFRGERNVEHASLRPFRLRFVPFALSQATLGLPWAGAALIAPSGAKAILLVFGAFKVVFGGALSGLLIHRFFPIRANEGELRGRAFIGWARRVRWEEIAHVQRRQWLFAPYLLVSTHTRRNYIWLPLFLCEQREFDQNIERWLAPEHPLREFLAGQKAKKASEPEPSSCPTS